MLATYVSVALVVVGSMMVGRAVFLVLGRHGWTGLEPAVGLAGLIAVAGILARFPGHHKTIALGVGLVGLATLAVLLRERRARRRIDPGDPPPPNAPAPGLTYRDLWAVAACVAVVLVALSLPFLINGRWGIIGLGVNNDLGLHLAWAEWLRTGLGPVPDPGYPIGPHGLVTALAWVPGVDPAQAFTGLVIAIGVITALTALAAVRPRRAAPEGRLVATPEGRATPGEQAPAAPVTPPLGLVSGVLVAALTALCYLAVAYFAQSAFKETGAALFVLAFALFLPWITAGIGRWPALAVITILAGGITFSYSFPGLAWPVAIGGLWALTRPGLWQALHPRRLPSTLWHPFSLAVLAVLAVAAAMLGLTERYGFGEGFSNVAGSDTYGPVSPLEALGLWPEPNYRLAAVGWPALTVPAGLIGIAALATALWGHLRRRLYLLPIALTASAIVYLASLPVSGDYSRAKALMILAPLAMLLIASGLLAGPPRGNPGAAPGSRRGTPDGAGGDPLRLAGRLARPAWIAVAVLFIAGSAFSSLLVLRDTRVAAPGHGAELQSFMPWIAGKPVLYAGQDRHAAYHLRGADAAVPLVEFPDERITESATKPFDTGDAYSPIDFDSFNARTFDRFPYVITGAAAWNSNPPPNFEEVFRTDSYILWSRNGDTPEGRNTLIEGTEAGVELNCAEPESEILSRLPGRATLFGGPMAVGDREDWQPGRVLRAGERATITLELPPGRWRLSLQYFAPGGLTLRAPGFAEELIPASDGERPAAISLENDGQYWPAGEYESETGEEDARREAGRRGGAGEDGAGAEQVTFTAEVPEAGLLAGLLGTDRPTYLGGLVAVPDRAAREVPLARACGAWVDSYTGGDQP